MIPHNHTVYGEIVELLKDVSNNKFPIYNSIMLTKPPRDERRIEFKLINFYSTGQIYDTVNKGGSDYKVGTISEYKCQLSIRVFDSPTESAIMAGRIVGAIQTFDYLSRFAKALYVLNETLAIRPFSIQKDNVIINYQEVLVDCYIGVDWEASIDYFTKVEDVSLIVDEPKITTSIIKTKKHGGKN